MFNATGFSRGAYQVRVLAAMIETVSRSIVHALTCIELLGRLGFSSPGMMRKFLCACLSAHAHANTLKYP
jgi:hypothetical protein